MKFFDFLSSFRTFRKVKMSNEKPTRDNELEIQQNLSSRDRSGVIFQMDTSLEEDGFSFH